MDDIINALNSKTTLIVIATMILQSAILDSLKDIHLVKIQKLYKYFYGDKKINLKVIFNNRFLSSLLVTFYILILSFAIIVSDLQFIQFFV